MSVLEDINQGHCFYNGSYQKKNTHPNVNAGTILESHLHRVFWEKPSEEIEAGHKGSSLEVVDK